jgi:hypothetical protein
VTTRGREFVAPDGRPLFLKGINLGNWLLPEGYMFKFKNCKVNGGYLRTLGLR